MATVDLKIQSLDSIFDVLPFKKGDYVAFRSYVVHPDLGSKRYVSPVRRHSTGGIIFQIVDGSYCNRRLCKMKNHVGSHARIRYGYRLKYTYNDQKVDSLFVNGGLRLKEVFNFFGEKKKQKVTNIDLDDICYLEKISIVELGLNFAKFKDFVIANTDKV
jgi:hypothetical protein